MLLREYSNQYPDAPSVLPLIYQYGEEQTRIILADRQGKQIKIKRDLNSPDFMEFEYI
jgi:hypothetical protein